MKLQRVILTSGLVTIGLLGGSGYLAHQSIKAQASVRIHLTRTVPKAYRGIWYSKDSTNKVVKTKISAKRFDGAKLHGKTNTIKLGSHVMAFKVTGTGVKSNTMYVAGYYGVKVIRRTKIKERQALVIYSEMMHDNQVAVLYKTKHAKLIKAQGTDNPAACYYMYSRKTALKNQKIYKRMNVIIKKHLGKAVTKKVYKGRLQHNARVNDIDITYYAMNKVINNMYK